MMLASYKRVGGIHFARVGQIGFSFYRTQRQEPIFPDATLGVVFGVLFVVDLILVIKLI
jgi:hypothetical protein